MKCSLALAVLPSVFPLVMLSASQAAASSMLSPSPTAQLSPAQVIFTAETSTAQALGDQGAVDGSTAILFAGTDVPQDESAPRDVLFFHRDAAGLWTETQRIPLATALHGYAGRTVAISGDSAAVYAESVSTNPSQSRSRLYLFERDGQGVWSHTQSFTADFPGSQLGAVRSIDFAGEDLICAEQTVRGMRVLRRLGGPGTWAEVQAVSSGIPILLLTDVVAADDLFVITDERITAQVFERDGAGVWAQIGTIPQGPVNFGRPHATDGVRVAMTRRSTGSFFVESIEVYGRPGPGQGEEWILEATIPLPDFVGLGAITGTYSSGYSRLFLEDDTLAFVPGLGCTSQYGGALLTYRRSATGEWFEDDRVCTDSIFERLLDFDGETALTGSVSVAGAMPGDPPGAIGLSPIINADVDCDLDGVLDADQIAACFGCDLNGNQRLDVCEPLGLEYCINPVPNSSGQVGRLEAFGPSVPGQGTLAFRATGTSIDTLGFLASGRGSVGGGTPAGNGVLCIAGPDLGRWISQAANTGNVGQFVVQVDTTMMPNSSGTTSVLSGQVWQFQAWFRDAGSFNLSSALAVRFD